MRSPCRAFIAPVDVRPTGVAARPSCLVPRLAGRLARDATGLVRLVVAFFAIGFLVATFLRFLAVTLRPAGFFAVVFLAVTLRPAGFFAVVFLAVTLRPAGFFAVVFLAVTLRPAGFFAVVFFVVVLVPVLFAAMVASLVTLTLGST